VQPNENLVLCEFETAGQVTAQEISDQTLQNHSETQKLQAHVKILQSQSVQLQTLMEHQVHRTLKAKQAGKNHQHAEKEMDDVDTTQESRYTFLMLAKIAAEHGNLHIVTPQEMQASLYDHSLQPDGAHECTPVYTGETGEYSSAGDMMSGDDDDNSKLCAQAQRSAIATSATATNLGNVHENDQHNVHVPIALSCTGATSSAQGGALVPALVGVWRTTSRQPVGITVAVVYGRPPFCVFCFSEYPTMKRERRSSRLLVFPSSSISQARPQCPDSIGRCVRHPSSSTKRPDNATTHTPNGSFREAPRGVVGRAQGAGWSALQPPLMQTGGAANKHNLDEVSAQDEENEEFMGICCYCNQTVTRHEEDIRYFKKIKNTVTEAV